MSPPHHSDQDEACLRTEYRADETPVEAIVTAVAEVTGKSMLEMDPLGEVVDNDALTELLEGHDDCVPAPSVTFDYCAQRVTVTDDSVEIAPANVSE